MQRGSTKPITFNTQVKTAYKKIMKKNVLDESLCDIKETQGQEIYAISQEKPQLQLGNTYQKLDFWGYHVYCTKQPNLINALLIIDTNQLTNTQFHKIRLICAKSTVQKKLKHWPYRYLMSILL